MEVDEGIATVIYTLNTVECMPAKNLLSQLETGCAALIIADPPYGIGYQSGEKLRTPKRQNRKDGRRDVASERRSETTFGADVFDSTWIPEAYRALNENGALYLCTRWDVAHDWKAALEDAGFNVVQRIVWDKAHWGMGNLKYFGSQTEDILFAIKGDHQLKWAKRQGNVWRIGRGRVTGKDGGGRHPTQKPVDLFTRMIGFSALPGDLVVDPFCGSGSALVAAQRAKCHFVGCDIEVRYVEAAREWLQEERQSKPEHSMESLFQVAQP